MTIPRLTPAFDQAESANDLFEKFFSWRLSSSPEFATVLGIEGYDDKLGKEMNRNMSVNDRNMAENRHKYDSE